MELVSSRRGTSGVEFSACLTFLSPLTKSKLSVYADCWLVLLFGSHSMLHVPSAYRYHLLYCYFIGGTYKRHRVGALNLHSNSVLSKGHKPGWSKTTPEGM